MATRKANVQVYLRIEPDLDKQLTELARKERRSKIMMATVLIEEAINAREKGERDGE